MLSIELRAVFRGLLRSPSFTAMTIGTLGLAIGAHTAIFSVVRSVLLEPLPFEEPDRLVALWHEAPGLDVKGPVYQSPATYLTYRDEGSALEDVALWARSSVAITGAGAPQQVEAVRVTDGLLPVLRVAPVLGRRFTAEDDAVGAAPTVLLGHGYWTRTFGARESVLGESLSVNGVSHEIIGVQPRGLRLGEREPELWVPFPLDRNEVFVGDFSYRAIGRLGPGVSLDEAERDLARVLPRVAEKFPRGMTLDDLRAMDLSPSVVSLADDVVGDVGSVLWVLFGTMGIVLCIACANVLNLFLVRAERRGRETALRTALGASRLRLLRGRLLESGTVALAGGLVGAVIAALGVRLLLAVGPESLPRLHDLGVDASAVAFAFGLALVTALVLGVLPMRGDGVPASRAGRGSESSPGRRRARSALVVAQLALALTLLVGAGLMMRSFQALVHVDPGFSDPSSLMTLRIRIPDAELADPREVAAAHERILRAIEAVPGVDSAGLSSSVTLDGWTSADGVHVEDFPTPEGEMTRVHRFKWISEGYFETMGNPVLTGRGITWADVHEEARVVVVTEDFASSYWGSPELALGRRIRQAPDEPWRRIVGIVGAVHDDGPGEPVTSTVYWPMVVTDFWDREVFTRRHMGYAIRTSRYGAPGFADELRAAVASVNPNLPVAAVHALDELVERTTSRTTFTLTLLGVAALAALLLGTVGVYGVVSYVAAQRTHEIGVRMALGARRADVRRLVLGHGAALTGAGLVVGILCAVVLSRLLGSLLYGVETTDFVTYATVSATLAAISLLACYLPARRAASIHPTEALRWE